MAAALRARNLFVIHQYPACGFHIDLVCEKEGGIRLAIECDGERFHLDEHGQPKLEDIEREATLRRAGWRVVRVPYRKWLRNREGELAKILAALEEQASEGTFEPPQAAVPDGTTPAGTIAAASTQARTVTPTQDAIIRALREGLTDEQQLLYRVRDLLGARRLTGKLKDSLLADALELSRLGLITTEDHEHFLTAEGRAATLSVIYKPAMARGRYRRRQWRRRRW